MTSVILTDDDEMVMSGSALQTWNGVARVAVVFQLVFEQWEGTHVEPGRHTAPQLPLEAIAAGRRDHVSLSWQDYGGRAGFGRLMDMVARHGVPCSALVNGLAAERYPDLIREFAVHGWDLAAHGWAQERRPIRLSRDEQVEDVRRTCEVLRNIGGCEVVGWASPGHQPSPDTLAIVAAKGLSYVAERVDGDRPVLLMEAGRRIVAIPPAFDVTDRLVYGRGLNGACAYLDLFKRQVDLLRSESGPPVLVTAAFHATLFGHPVGARALRDCIMYARSLRDVTITTHRACAEAWASADAI